VYSAATIRLLERASEAFVAHGYAELTMGRLGELCGLQRRALYYHFHNKEELFRAVLRVRNAHFQALADEVAAQALECGDPVAQIMGRWLDTRYGEVRRQLAGSPHGAELNTVAFAVGLDIMLDEARETNLKLQALIEGLVAQKRLQLRAGTSAENAAQMISDGARGVNQARPAVPAGQLAARYHAIAEAILFGCAVKPPARRKNA
jgi:AcrR family transcriptional regulator